MSDDQVAPELKPIKTKLEGILGELKQLQASGTPTQAQVGTPEPTLCVQVIASISNYCATTAAESSPRAAALHRRDVRGREVRNQWHGALRSGSLC